MNCASLWCCRQLAERGVELHDIVDVLVGNVLHAPDSTALAASAVTTIAMSFPAQALSPVCAVLTLCR